jgi:Arc/MetJ-type ribon-helix-helix transcriptional regulator
MRTIQVELPEQTAEEIEGYVRAGRFASAAEAVRTAVLDFVRRRRREISERPSAETRKPQEHRPIEEVLAEIAAQVPDKEWERLPADLSDNLDHYLYGAPKR